MTDMTIGVAVMTFYTSRSMDDIVEDTHTTCEQAGFEVDPTHERTDTVGENEYDKIDLRYKGGSFTLSFNTADDRPPDEPLLNIGCGQKIYPSELYDSVDYPGLMDGILELFCRLATTLEADYAPLFDSEGRAAVPEGRPIGESVEEIPPMGIYSQTVLEQFGGVEAMFETSPWYTADLDGGLTLVIESEEPWQNGGWRPPTEAPYLNNASFAGADPDTDA